MSNDTDAAIERRVRAASREMLARSGFGDARLTLLRGRSGFVYRVDCDPGRFTLRVRPAAAMSRPAAAALRRWMSSLARHGGVTVPEPVRIGGTYLAAVGGHAAATFRWVEGRPPRDARHFVEPGVLESVARATAMLHLHAKRFGVGGADSVTRWDDAKFLGDDSCVGQVGRRLLKSSDGDAIRPAAAKLRAALRELGTSPRHLGLIHRDLEPANWVFHRGEARPVDFDEFGVGHYLFDLAQVLWTHAMWPGHDQYLSRLIAAYEAVRPLSSVERKHLRATQALPLLDWINRGMKRDDREGRDAMKRWLKPTVKRVRELCDVG